MVKLEDKKDPAPNDNKHSAFDFLLNRIFIF